jgi:hypothetical protein
MIPFHGLILAPVRRNDEQHHRPNNKPYQQGSLLWRIFWRYDINFSPVPNKPDIGLGEAALIAMGGSSLGLGTDIGMLPLSSVSLYLLLVSKLSSAGSVRVPAAFCGIYGIKPSSNRFSYRGVANTVRLNQVLIMPCTLSSTNHNILAESGANAYSIRCWFSLQFNRRSGNRHVRALSTGYQLPWLSSTSFMEW